MKMILIDAFNRKIRQIDREPKLETYYELIGCRTIDAVYLENQNVGYVDDEGLLSNPQHFFHIPGIIPYPLAGNMVIIGTDDQGNDVAPHISADDISPIIQFMTIDEVRQFVAEHPGL